MMDRKLRVAIDYRVADGKQQGIGTAVLALAKTLSSSPIAHQEYTFIVLDEMRDWLAPYIGGPCTLLSIPPSSVSTAKSALRHIAPLRFLWQRARRGLSYIPKSDGVIESLGFDVVHFPAQKAYLTDVPSIYQPWDLQHRHLPQFFEENEIAVRNRLYRAFCNQAKFVCVQAEWTRQDVVNNLQISPEKVVVIPWGCVFDAYTSPTEKTIAETKEKLALPEFFFVYPAVTWPHKNHEVILRALHRLKLEGAEVPTVYFTGNSTPYRAVLEDLASELGVGDFIHFLGFLDPLDLQAVFALSTAMIFASRFEGFGLPILEAFHARIPVLASTATTLPEVAQDGALFFDPDSPEQLGELIKRLRREYALRTELIRKGTVVLSRSSIQSTVTAFQTLYDRTAVEQNVLGMDYSDGNRG